MAKAARKSGASAGNARDAATPTAATARSDAAQSKASEALPNTLAANGQPDEEALLADVSSILDPLVLLGEQAQRAAPSPGQAPPAAASSESALQAAQLMARQHAEYQRSVELVRQQLAHRHMQQMQQTQQQHLQLQRQQQQQQQYQQNQQHAAGAPSPTVGASPSSASGSASVMHHIQQRLQERIQNKQHQQLYDQMRRQAAAAVAAAGSSTAPDAAVQQQLQIQQYHALIRELEMQAVAAAAAGPPTPPTAGMSQEELERLRQERLQRLHQMQLHQMQHQQLHMQAQAQHAAALRVTLTGVPPVDQPSQQRAQMHVDLDRLRKLQQQQQLQSPSPPAAPSTAKKPQETQAKAQEAKPKATKATPKKRAADQLTVAAGKEINTETGAGPSNASEHSAIPAVEAATVAASPSAASTVPPPKKKRKTPAESQMEALVRVLCRLHLSKNESEMRSQLEKLATWIGKSADVCLLRFALRDFVEIFGLKQKQFEKSAHWSGDLMPKCTYLHDKLRHAIAALDQAKVAKVELTANPTEQSIAPAPSPPTEDAGAAALAPASQSTVASNATQPTTSVTKPLQKTKSTPESDAITLAAREHAYAALKEQMMANLMQPKPRATPAAKAAVQTGTAATGPPAPAGPDSATVPDAKPRIPQAVDGKGATKKKKRDLSIDVNAGAEAKGFNPASDQDGPPTAPSTTTAAKQAPPARPAPPPTPVSTVISPRVAQHLFDLELTPRSCTVAPDEGEERFYIPLKPISNIMRKILPGGGPTTVRRRRKKRRNAWDAENADGDTPAKKKNDDEDEDDDDGEDGDGDVGGDDGDENDARDGDDNDEMKGEKLSEPAATSGIPQPKMSSIMEEPPVKIDDDALTFMQECVTEFMLFFTSEARDQAAYEKKKGSITGFNIIHAMENLGFSPYAKVLANYNDKVRKVQDEAAHVKQERKNLAKARKLQAQQAQLDAEQAKQAEAAALLAGPGDSEMKSEARSVVASDARGDPPNTSGGVGEPMVLSSPDPVTEARADEAISLT